MKHVCLRAPADGERHDLRGGRFGDTLRAGTIAPLRQGSAKVSPPRGQQRLGGILGGESQARCGKSWRRSRWSAKPSQSMSVMALTGKAQLLDAATCRRRLDNVRAFGIINPPLGASVAAPRSPSR